MNLFFDTSALVKFFHEEEGSEVFTQLITSQENEIWISELVRLEFMSALFRRFRNKEINDKQLTEAILGFNEGISFLTKVLQFHIYNPSVIVFSMPLFVNAIHCFFCQLCAFTFWLFVWNINATSSEKKFTPL